MTRPLYFFDTYALLRVFAGDPAFERFADEPVFTDAGCLYEFARQVLAREGASGAREALAGVRAERVVPTDEDLIEAAKLHQRSSRVSAQDALAYTLAQANELRFLTGDRAFRGLPGVEFVE